MKADYINGDMISHILALLTPENALVCRVQLATGLRVGDVLALRTEQLRKGNRTNVREEKTGKSRRITIPIKLYDEIMAQAGKVWVFEGRNDPNKHRTRQALNKDLKRASKALRLQSQVSTHTMRKKYAVDYYRAHDSDLKKLQHLFNHENESVTMIYALADILSQRGKKTGSTRRKH